MVRGLRSRHILTQGHAPGLPTSRAAEALGGVACSLGWDSQALPLTPRRTVDLAGHKARPFSTPGYLFSVNQPPVLELPVFPLGYTPVHFRHPFFPRGK